MNLREHLRDEWSKYIRPLMVKDKCEWCGCESDLHLHHIDRFHNLLVETLEELQLQELDVEFYDEMELKQISNFMLAKQIKSEYKTLCKSCHLKLHSKEKFDDEYRNNYYNPNGGYVNINQDTIKELELEESKSFKFFRLICNINYDNFITDGSRRIKLNKFITESGCSEISNLLNISNRESKKCIEYFLEYNLVEIMDDGSILINKDIATKGFNNYKNKIKLFVESYKNVYSQIDEIRRHKIVGNIILNAIYNLENIDIESIYNVTNASKYKRYLKEVKNLCKFNKNKIQINPSLIYKKELDFSYKEEIEKYNSI